MSAAVVDSPAVLHVDSRGVVLAEIPDSKGEVHSYSLARTPEGFDAFAVSLTRLDGKGSSPHRVAVNHAGRWRCTCEDAKYRPNRRGRCIHVTFCVRPLYALICRLTAKEES